MDIKKYMSIENEKPLDNIVYDGGFCKIFRKIACIGDSLSSGEFESYCPENGKGYHDFYEYSWGQYMAREAGIDVLNFSRGGMTAKEYNSSFAAMNGFWNEDKVCQAYILALGVNDIIGQNQEIGTIEDINTENRFSNNPTFAGEYAKIIQCIKAIQPKAKFFLMTMPKTENEEHNNKKTVHQSFCLFNKSYLKKEIIIEIMVNTSVPIPA